MIMRTGQDESMSRAELRRRLNRVFGLQDDIVLTLDLLPEFGDDRAFDEAIDIALGSARATRVLINLLRDGAR